MKFLEQTQQKPQHIQLTSRQVEELKSKTNANSLDSEEKELFYGLMSPREKKAYWTKKANDVFDLISNKKYNNKLQKKENILHAYAEENKKNEEIKSNKEKNKFEIKKKLMNNYKKMSSDQKNDMQLIIDNKPNLKMKLNYLNALLLSLGAKTTNNNNKIIYDLYGKTQTIHNPHNSSAIDKGAFSALKGLLEGFGISKKEFSAASSYTM